MSKNYKIDLAEAAEIAFRGSPSQLSATAQSLRQIIDLFHLDPECPLTFTLDDSNKDEIKASIQSHDGMKLPHGYTQQIDYILHQDSYLILDRTIHEISLVLESDEPQKTTIAYPLDPQIVSLAYLARAFIRSAEDMMSVGARERLGNIPAFRDDTGPMAPLMHIVFPAFPHGVAQLESVFPRLNNLLREHTNGLLEAGVRYEHAGFHEFWVGRSWDSIKKNGDDWAGEYDRTGWSIAGDRKQDSTYGVDETNYTYNDEDFDKDQPTLPTCRESIGWLPFTAADILGQAAKWIETSVMNDMPEELEMGLLTLMEEFPPNPKAEEPSAEAGLSPALR